MQRTQTLLTWRFKSRTQGLASLCTDPDFILVAGETGWVVFERQNKRMENIMPALLKDKTSAFPTLVTCCLTGQLLMALPIKNISDKRRKTQINRQTTGDVGMFSTIMLTRSDKKQEANRPRKVFCRVIVALHTNSKETVNNSEHLH